MAVNALKRKDFPQEAPFFHLSEVKRQKVVARKDTIRQLQLPNVVTLRSSKKAWKTVKVTNPSNFKVIYSNQRQFFVPQNLLVDGKLYFLGERRSEVGSASVVSFYRTLQKVPKKMERVAVKTVKLLKREFEHENVDLTFKNDFFSTEKVNERLRDELTIQDYLKSTFKGDVTPVVDVYGAVVYEIGESFQVSTVMEEMETTLEEVLLRNAVDVEILLNTAVSLEKLHKVGIIYADLKLSNVLVNVKSGKVAFSDFDCSNLEGNLKESEGMSGCGGTLRYLSPQRQLCESNEAEKSDDVWAFGVLLIEACAGKKLVNKCFTKVPNLSRFSKFEDDVAEVLTELISHCLEHEREDRPTFSEIVDTLEMLL